VIRFLDLKKQYDSISDEINCAISNVISESAFIGGKYVKNFEEDFGKYCNVKYSISVGNGTDALEIAIEAAELAPDSEILVPANSFIASSEAVTRTGHRVRFVDVNPDDYTISIDSIRQHINSKTAAIIAVHLYGHPCEMDSILQIAEEHGLVVIEDCAQAHGAEYRGRKVGTIGDFGAFSFYPGKNLGAYGDGGMITTNSSTYAKRAQMIANHGRVGKYDHEFEGRNSRLDGIQAAILSVKLKYIEEWTQTRIDVAEQYADELEGVSHITLPVRQNDVKQVYHLFVIRVDNRAELKKFLSQFDIQTGIHYPVALPNLKAYEYARQGTEKFFSCNADQKLLSLPIGDHIRPQDVKFVADRIKEFYGY